MTSRGHTVREPAEGIANTCWGQSLLESRWGHAAVWVQKNGSGSWEGIEPAPTGTHTTRLEDTVVAERYLLLFGPFFSTPTPKISHLHPKNKSPCTSLSQGVRMSSQGPARMAGHRSAGAPGWSCGGSVLRQRSLLFGRRRGTSPGP